MTVPKGYDVTQTPRMTPDQRALFDKMLGGVGQYLPGGIDYLGKLAMGDEGAYSQMNQSAMNNFNQKIIPGLAAQFGSHGTLNSSAFNNAAAGAGANLSADLAGQRQRIQMEALFRMLGLGNEALGHQPYEYGLQKKKNWWDYLQEGVGMATDIAGAAAAFI